MAIFQTTPTMSRKEIIEKIKKDTGCDDVQANRIFHKAVEDKVIAVRLNWNFIIGLVIYSMVVVTAIWAIWRHL